MKRLLAFGAALLLLWLCLNQAQASELEQALLGGTDPSAGLDEEVLDRLGEYQPDSVPGIAQGLREIWNLLLEHLLPTVRDGTAAVCLCLCTLLLCGIAADLPHSGQAVHLAGCLGLSAVCAGNLHTLMGLGAQTVTGLHDYVLLLLPTLTSLMVTSGAAAAGAGIYTAGVFFLELLMTLMLRVLVPLVYLFAAMGICGAALGVQRLDPICDLLQWLCSWSLKLILYVFTGYLMFSGVLAASTDAAKLRAARIAMSGAVPMVGGILSDASDTLLTAAGILRASLGTYGMLAVLGLCAVPFLRIGVQYLLLRLTAGLGGVLGSGRLVGLLHRFVQSMGMLLAMTGAYCVMCLFALVFTIKAVGL